MVGWRRVAGLALILAALLGALAGCGVGGQQPSDLASDQTLKMVWPLTGLETMFALDPAQVETAGGAQFTTLLYDSLVTLDRNEHIEPWGAESWIVSPDGLTYTFTLRPNQRFSDGAPVTHGALTARRTPVLARASSMISPPSRAPPHSPHPTAVDRRRRRRSPRWSGARSSATIAPIR